MPKLYRTIPDLSPQDIARFWAKVDKAGPIPPHRPELGPCWIWTAASVRRGYGFFSVGGGMYAAPRIAWMIVFGALAPGLFVCHHCDHPPCVNPTHLFLGTNRENIHDARAKGRLATGERNGAHLHPERLPTGERNGSRLHPERVPRGEAHHSAQLTADQVREIRTQAAARTSYAALGRAYGVSATNISAIVRRKKWTHLP